VPGGDLTEEEQSYLSDLKKCEALEDAHKRICAAEVKREHGEKW
jgi:hypothetical protein